MRLRETGGIVDDASLIFSESGDDTVAGIISGSGAMTVANSPSQRGLSALYCSKVQPKTASRERRK